MYPKLSYIRSFFTTRAVVSIASYTALSSVMGLVKLPSPSGSIALDSAPAFFAAGYVSPIVGGLVGFSGHLASALSGGFPQGPLHFVIAFGMFITCLLYGVVIKKINRKWGLYFAGGIAVALNSSIPLMCIPFGLRYSVAVGFIPYLVFAAGVNVFLASAMLFAMSKMSVKGI